MACNCSKKTQPTGFAKPSPGGAQADQRSGAGSVPGSITSRQAPPPAGAR